MNDRLKELAEQAGITERWNGWNSVIPVNGDGVQSEYLERFAELIRADEREACAEHYLGIMRNAVEQAVLKEREACAKLCEEENWSHAMGNIIRSERGVA